MSLWKPPASAEVPRVGYRFNPCSLGCRSESKSRVGYMHLYHLVSILVLLDVALKVNHCISKKIVAKGFNPCSLGCRSERDEESRATAYVKRFQSLFSWMSLWKYLSSEGWEIETLFQSLFSWMSLWKATRPTSPQSCQPCFNPCSLGCRSERLSSCPSTVSLPGFNPCSLGCRSERRYSENGCRLSPPGFNPCSLGCRSEREVCGRSGVSGANVSILVLLDVALKENLRARGMSVRVGFNPCSLGCRSESAMDVNIKILSIQVSILVLLDVALKVSDSPLSILRALCFNPCSLGCRSERPKCIGHALAVLRFQSLFSWMSLWKRTGTPSSLALYSSFNPCSLGCRSESYRLRI